MENADPYTQQGYGYANDWCNFRTTFWEASCSQSLFHIVHPQQCTDPGADGVREEAEIDPQWASAAAPGATIFVASCQDSGTTMPGYLIALQNYVDKYTQQIISISFGTCEADLGPGGNSILNATYEQAAAEGFSVFGAAGDGGAAGCDYAGPTGYATHGIAVSGYASSPYVVAVGGTTFADVDMGNATKYWNSQNGTNGYNDGSAISYIPEIAWNSSCGNRLLATFYGFQQTYGSTGLCNSGFHTSTFLTVVGGSGGPSTCGEIVYPGGACAGYPKPSWQSGIFGNPDDQVRDVPDVSIFAGGAEWGHNFVYCSSYYVVNSCGGSPWILASGTSFSAPIFAGIQALIDDRIGEQVGNPSATYYGIARQEYGQNGNSNCLSIIVAAPNSCAFYDIFRPQISGRQLDCRSLRGPERLLSRWSDIWRAIHSRRSLLAGLRFAAWMGFHDGDRLA